MIKIWVLALLVCIGASVASPVIAANGDWTDALFETGTGIPQEFRYFAVVMQADTERGARESFACLRQTHPTMTFAVYKTPETAKVVPVRPYSVFVASYATNAEADAALADSRNRIDYSKAFVCLHLNVDTSSPVFQDFLKKNSFVFEAHIKPSNWPRALDRTPLAPFDGIGQIRTQTAPTPVNVVIEPVAQPSASAMSAIVADYRARAPDVHFVAVQTGQYYFLAAAVFVDEAAQDHAMTELRRRGLYQVAFKATMQPTTTQITTQETPKAYDLLGHERTIDTPVINQTSSVSAVAALESEDLLEPLAARVQRCYALDGHATTGLPERLASCAGVVLTPEALTRCLLNSNCIGLRVPVGFLDDPWSRLADCLKAPAPGTACQGTTVDPALASLLSQAGMAACMVSANNPACGKIADVLTTMCTDPLNQTVCTQHADFVSNLSNRFAAIQTCLNDHRCDTIVARPADIAVRVRSELNRLQLDLATPVDIQSTGLAFLDGTAQQQLDRFKTCTALRDANKKDDADACFVNMALHDNELKLVTCFQAASTDTDKIACFSQGGDLSNAIAQANCVKSKGGDVAAAATCLGGKRAQQISDAMECVHNASSPAEAAIKCSNALPPNASAALTCVLGAKDSATVMGCLPVMDPREIANLCISATPADRVNCIAKATDADPNVVAAINCARDAHDVTTAAACLPVSDPRAKAAVCIAKATTDADRIACAGAIPGVDATVASALDCARSATDAGSALACLPVTDPREIAAICMATAATDSDRLACTASAIHIDPQIAKALDCARAATDATSALSCLPVTDARQKTALCVATATSDAQRLACATTVLNVDPKTAAIVGCLAAANGNNAAMASCAAQQFMPKQVALAISCAATSTGAVSFALCAAGPQMNEELRTAVECAVSTGGVPVAAAVCTAGALTIRELEKCLEGQIGTDGGCFGPNNTIVKTFSNMLNDITKGPGPNNDLVKLVNSISNGVGQFAKGATDFINQAASDFKRSDPGKFICNIFGC